jgi:periplasmic divalent cation tolerance protein
MPGGLLVTNSEFCVLLWTAPSEGEARRVIQLLLEERDVACAHLLPAGVSLYWWNGEICESQEHQVLFKTLLESTERVFSAIQKAGSYENPELLGLPVVCQSPAYGGWIRASVRVPDAK